MARHLFKLQPSVYMFNNESTKLILATGKLLFHKNNDRCLYK